MGFCEFKLKPASLVQQMQEEYNLDWDGEGHMGFLSIIAYMNREQFGEGGQVAENGEV